MKFFVALVDAGSVTGAARVLGVEHTTVARRIDALEASLELRLFDRFPRAWSLTAEGSNLVEAARGVEDQVLAFARTSSAAAALEGGVRISGPPLLLSQIVIPGMKETLARLDGIELEFIGEARAASLTRREADIALRLERPSEASLTAKLLATFGFGLYALPHYLGRATLDLVRVEGVVCAETRKLWLVIHDDVRHARRVRAVADELTALFALAFPQTSAGGA